MKYLIPFAVVAGLAGPAAGGGPPGTPTVSDGLGDAGGFATEGGFFIVGPNGGSIAWEHVFLYSGAQPYASGYVLVHLPQTFYPPNSNGDKTARARPMCNVTTEWADPLYTPPGYTNPEPWGLWTGVGQYDNSNATGPTLNLIWMGQFPPMAAMSAWISCGNKVGGD